MKQSALGQSVNKFQIPIVLRIQRAKKKLFHNDFLRFVAQSHEIHALRQCNGRLAIDFPDHHNLTKQVAHRHTARAFHSEAALGGIGIDIERLSRDFGNRKVNVYQDGEAAVDVVFIKSPYCLCIATIEKIHKSLALHEFFGLGFTFSA